MRPVAIEKTRASPIASPSIEVIHPAMRATVIESVIQIGGTGTVDATIVQNGTRNYVDVIHVGGTTNALIGQSGVSNTANITQIGNSTNALLLQIGDMNTGTVRQFGRFNWLAIFQFAR